jgi:hypothetical protein
MAPSETYKHFYEKCQNAESIARILDIRPNDLIIGMCRCRSLYAHIYHTVSLDFWLVYGEHEVWQGMQSFARSYDSKRHANIEAAMVLIVHDHAVDFLNMSSEELITWIGVPDDPVAILMLPVIFAFEEKARDAKITWVADKISIHK